MSWHRLFSRRVTIPTASILVLSIAIWFITPPSQLPRVPPNLTSGQQEAFLGLTAGHRGAPQKISNDLLQISAFMTPGVAHQYFVKSNGEETDHRNVWNWAIQSQDIKQLTAEDLKGIHQALLELPQKSDDPPVQRLVVISFWQREKWTTRSYDSESLPEPMTRILGIIHRRESRFNELFEKWLKENPFPTQTIIKTNR